MLANRLARGVLVLVTLALGLSARPHAAAAIDSTVESVQLVARPFGESLSLGVTPGIINFSLSSFAAAGGDAPLSTSVDYALDPQGGSRDLRIFWYFADANAALSNGSHGIPAARVLGDPSVGVYFPFESDLGFGTGVVQALSIASGSGNYTVDMNLRIDTAGMQLQPGDYSGTLFIQAEVF